MLQYFPACDAETSQTVVSCAIKAGDHSGEAFRCKCERKKLNYVESRLIKFVLNIRYRALME